MGKPSINDGKSIKSGKFHVSFSRCFVGDWVWFHHILSQRYRLLVLPNCMSRMARKKHLQDWRSRDSWPLGNPFMFICCASRYTWVHDLKHFQVPLSLHLPVSPGSEWLAPAIHFSIFSWTMILHDSPTFPGYISTFAFLSWFHIPICWLSAVSSRWNLHNWPQAATERPAEPLSLQWLCAGRLTAAAALALHYWHWL